MRRWRWARLREGVYRRVGRRARRVRGRGPLLVAIGDSHTGVRTPYTLPRQGWLRIVGRKGYKVVNLGVWGETTGEMRQRIEQALSEGRPEIVVVFGGENDAARGVDPAETERNVSAMVTWLRSHGVRKIVLIGPGLLNYARDPARVQAVDQVRTVLRGVAVREGAIFVDLVQILGERIERGDDPDFSRVPYRQRRSWHASAGDPHYNAYGQRLIADAFLAATAEWRRAAVR